MHYTFPDDVEMVEEYETRSSELLGKWKKLNTAVNGSYSLLQGFFSGQKIIVINFEIFHSLYWLIFPRLVVKT